MDLRRVCIIIFWFIGCIISIGVEQSMDKHNLVDEISAIRVMAWPLTLIVWIIVGIAFVLISGAKKVSDFALDFIYEKFKGDKND